MKKYFCKSLSSLAKCKVIKHKTLDTHQGTSQKHQIYCRVAFTRHLRLCTDSSQGRPEVRTAAKTMQAFEMYTYAQPAFRPLPFLCSKGLTGTYQGLGTAEARTVRKHPTRMVTRTVALSPYCSSALLPKQHPHQYPLASRIPLRLPVPSEARQGPPSIETHQLCTVLPTSLYRSAHVYTCFWLLSSERGMVN